MISRKFKAPKPGETTWLDVVREYLPDVSEEEASGILWEFTSFPFGDEAEVRQHLSEFVAGA